MTTLAIDIGGTKFALALFEEGRMIERAGGSTDRAGGPLSMLDRIGDVCRDWKVRIDRCGIGFGGPVDFPSQRVVRSTHVPGWDNFDLPREVEKLAGVRPIMDNDAKVGALGEAVYGAGRGYRPLFYMTLSTGIDGGLIPEAESVYQGADSYAGEIGHLTIRPDGPECLCGARGCFERLCCGLWLERDHGRPAYELLRDPAFVARYVVDLALGLKAAIMLLNPARIVIGGGISKAGEALFAPLRSELLREITAWSRAHRRGPGRTGRRQRALRRFGAGRAREARMNGFRLPAFYPVLDTFLLAKHGLSASAAAEAILDAGARILQFRHKQFFSRAVFEEAQRVAELCRAANALFVMNDRADLAVLLGAGLHLGQDDLAPADARKILRPGGIIGFSTHNREQLRAGDAEPVDYLAIGPIFATGSKQNPDPVVGLAELRALRASTKKPLVAIGGVTRETARPVIEAGADSLAVIGDLYPEPLTTAALRERTKEWLAIAG